MADQPALAILGTRGIPARHGGFETFAQRLALHLVGRGWQVDVWCQDDEPGAAQQEWRGIRLRHVFVRGDGPAATLAFDWRSLRGALNGDRRLLLTLGYNSGMFALLSRLRRRANLVNMDGIEWRRAKWSMPARAWFRLNEFLACRLHDHLIADHPAIADHLARTADRARITTIPYGADPVLAADPGPVQALGLDSQQFALVIARPEPENSILEIVGAFSRRPRGTRLVVLGDVHRQGSAYRAAVRAAAGPEVVFPGAIHDQEIVAALRFHCRLYVHGHQVGGTNPSLVEALGAGSAVLAHDNPFNRWVAGPGACYFDTPDSCAAAFDRLLDAPEPVLRSMREASIARHRGDFQWPDVLARYEELLLRWWHRV